MAVLLLINGAPGVGKTTLLRRLATELDIPALAKDDIKEFLFDALGYSNRDWSRILGRAAAESLYSIAKEFLLAGQSIAIENTFYPEYAKPVLDLLSSELHIQALEIYCYTDDETRLTRFSGRKERGERHPAHVDNLATMRDVTKHGSLSDNQAISFDTTNPSEADYQSLMKQLQSALVAE